MVTFELNKQLDIDMAAQFLNTRITGVDFGRAVWEYHPELRRIDPYDVNLIANYFDTYYEENEKELAAQVTNFQTQWNTVEREFMFVTKRLFDNRGFPAGKYKAYISSYNCNPHFIEDKTFQIFSRYMNCVALTANELMHFMFYDFTATHMKHLFGGLPTEKGIYYDIAEIFNNVVLSMDKFKKILRIDGEIGQLDHQKHFPQANKLFRSSDTIQDFIISLYEYLRDDTE